MNQTATSERTLPLIVSLLLSKRHLNQRDLDAIREAKSKDDIPLEEILIRKHFASEGDIATAYADYYVIPLFTPEQNQRPVDPAIRSLLPEKICRDHLIAPVAVRDGTLDLVFFTPNEFHLIEEVQLLTGLAVRPQIAPLSVVEALLGNTYDNSAWPVTGSRMDSAEIEQLEEDEEGSEDDTEPREEVIHLDQPPPPGRDGRIIRYLNHILEQAFRAGASDIHLEPLEDQCRVRLRIDGELNEVTPPPRSMYTPIISRIKVLAKMDIAEKRLPQDGAIALKSGEMRMDVRVNSVPTIHGEKIVLRILDKNAIPLDLSKLGMDQRQAADLLESIQMPHGLMLVTGPTGSGKSTTLYACLNLLNKSGDNICTVEDPVEYKFSGINQVQVKSQIGFTFATALRSFLRQDPDIIMVGEVRDAETAQICVRAALTGHFVLSTLHTNDALSAINRLGDMDIEPFLLASTLRALVAQRLLRRLCSKCREPNACDSQTARRIHFQLDQTIYRPRGCKDCRESGYRGRVGIYEVIRVTRELAGLIQSGTSLQELRESAIQQGMKFLRQSALEKVQEGVTSLEEALSVTISEYT